MVKDKSSLSVTNHGVADGEDTTRKKCTSVQTSDTGPMCKDVLMCHLPISRKKLCGEIPFFCTTAFGFITFLITSLLLYYLLAEQQPVGH